MRIIVAVIYVASALICFAVAWREIGKSHATYGELERRRQARR